MDRNRKMKWCNRISMWCDDIEDEEIEMCGCDGNCKGCEDCELVQGGSRIGSIVSNSQGKEA